MPRSYREYRPPVGLEAVVACLWEHQPAADRVQRVVPDGCVDLIWLADRLQLLADAVACRGAEPDALVIAAAPRLAVQGVRVAGVATELGVSERQLHRRMLAAVGYGPKMLARVARLRRLVALSDESLAWRALEAGYANQAHMNDEVRRLTGTTPVRFLKDAALTAA
jgi:AraC-like DNA-binding protein